MLKTGGVTIAGLSATTTTITSAGAADLSDISAATTTITVAGQDLAARRIEADGALTIATGAGDIALADLNVTGDTTISGVNIGSDASGAEETRVSVGGALDVGATGDVALTDLSVAGETDIAAGGSVTLDDLDLGTTTITADGDIALTNGRTADVSLDGGAVVTGANLRTAMLDVDAAGDVDLDTMQVTGDASILSTGGDVELGSVAVDAGLTAEAAAGAIRTGNSNFTLRAVTVSGATGAAPTTFGGNAVPADADVRIGAGANATLVSVTGDAYFLADGDIALIDDERGTTGDNDFMSGITAISGGAVMINDANDLVLGALAGVATPGGATFDSNGVTAAGSLRVEAGGDVTDALQPKARLNIGGDVLVLAGGDVILDNEIHAIDGAIAATGQDITLTERGTIRLGPITASGDLMVEAGADNATGAGTTGGVNILQDSAVTVADATVGGVADDDVREGGITVGGISTFTTGLNPATDLDSPSLTGRRDLVLNNRANDFGGRLNIARISGDVTITENSLTGATSDVQEIGNFEVGGTARLTTSDSLIFVGRMTSLTDDVVPAEATTRPVSGRARNQGDLDIADEDLRLFITSGESLIIDTTGGRETSTGANVRFDRPVDGANTVVARGAPSIGSERGGLGDLTITGGTTGEVRFRDFVGAANPLGDVDINAGSVFSGFTFAGNTPDQFTVNNRFLFDRTMPDDFFFADDVRVNAPGRIEFLTPPGTVETFILDDLYFGVNVTTFSFGDLGRPATIQAFGFIGRDRTRAIGLLPVGPRGSTFQFNDCVIGDVADCTNIPIPNVINSVLIAAPPLLGIETEDLLELFGSFGNEELWGVPQSYYSDFGTEEENKPDCPDGSEDPACKES